MDVARTVAEVRLGLAAHADPVRAAHDRGYLKSRYRHLGVSVPKARGVAGAVGRTVDHGDLRALVSALWSGDTYEDRLVAVLLLDRHAAVLKPGDLPWLADMLRQAGTWALVDLAVPRPLAAIDAAGTAATTAVLDRWAVDDDFWLRRSALLAHLIPLRTGLVGWPRFARYADGLLADREFFVRKAIGWVLRETARHDPDLVAAWVAPRIGRISGVALREAVRPLPEERRTALLAAYRGR